MNLKALVFIPLGVALVLTAACSKGDTVVQTSGNASGISSTGVGKVTGTPDVAILQLGVDVEKPTVDDARNTAAQSMQNAINALKADGVDDKDIKTTQFSISPAYDYNQGKQTLRGYHVTNLVSAKVRKIDQTGKAIDDVSKAAADQGVVRSVSFTIDDPSKLQAQARDLAVKQARQRAEQLANPAGVKVGKVISISETSTNVPSPQPFAAVAAAPRAADVTTPIQTGDLDITVTISATFAIE